MKYVVYADLHLWAGKYEWTGRLEYGAHAVYCGDCFEFKNISKSKIPECFDTWRIHLIKASATGTVTISGNHEVSIGKNHAVYEHITNGILFCHGHRVDYKKKKSDRWENKRAGVAWYTLFWQRYFKRRKFKESKWKEPSNKTKKKLADYARARGCRKIVVGHFHRKWKGEYNGVDIYMCGRGKTVLDI